MLSFVLSSFIYHGLSTLLFTLVHGVVPFLRELFKLDSLFYLIFDLWKQSGIPQLWEQFGFAGYLNGNSFADYFNGYGISDLWEHYGYDPYLTTSIGGMIYEAWLWLWSYVVTATGMCGDGITSLLQHIIDSARKTIFKNMPEYSFKSFWYSGAYGGHPGLFGDFYYVYYGMPLPTTD